MPRTRADLPESRLLLLREMQRVNFGRLESLVIRAGEPVIDPRPTIVREHKFGGENGPRPEIERDDFDLKRQVVELFEFFDQLQDGKIDVLEIRHGLPFRMIVTEVAA
jgi:hypothetical protein